MTRAGRLVRPRAISPGDSIAVIAPGSSFKKTLLAESVRWLKKRGYSVEYREDIFEKEGYLAGDDERRLAEWHHFWDQPKTKAIFAARGGYGAMRLLEKAGEAILPKSQKIFMGYSDVTVLLNYIAWKRGFSTVHGPLMAAESFLQLSEKTRNRNFSRFENGEQTLLSGDSDFTVFCRKNFRGTLWGGNLSMMAAVLGTPYFPDVEGGVLFLEDVNEAAYRLDRLFAQLALAGILRKLKGLILGTMTDEKGRSHRIEFLGSLIDRYVDTKSTGVLLGLKAGHRHQDVWLPIGGKVEFDQIADTLLLSPLVLKL